MDYPRFYTPPWGTAPIPADAKVDPSLMATNGYDFGNNVAGDTCVQFHFTSRYEIHTTTDTTVALCVAFITRHIHSYRFYTSHHVISHVIRTRPQPQPQPPSHRISNCIKHTPQPPSYSGMSSCLDQPWKSTMHHAQSLSSSLGLLPRCPILHSGHGSHGGTRTPSRRRWGRLSGGGQTTFQSTCGRST